MPIAHRGPSYARTSVRQCPLPIKHGCLAKSCARFAPDAGFPHGIGGAALPRACAVLRIEYNVRLKRPEAIW